jgi:hypothetical protein
MKRPYSSASPEFFKSQLLRSRANWGYRVAGNPNHLDQTRGLIEHCTHDGALIETHAFRSRKERQEIMGRIKTGVIILKFW